MNVSLPIHAFREDILAAVRKHPAVIITAETGAGKSTQVPQFLVDDEYDIVVTEPRRLAVRTVAKRVAQEMGETLGGKIIGYRTAYERQCDDEHTRCLFATDGLQLIRELMGAGRHQVLIIDEVHEWNINIETLVAWAKMSIDEGSNFKVVVMSATLEAEKLSEFFGGAPVISVPGRTFPVEVKTRGSDQAADVANLLTQGRNVLWFQPGKAEILACLDDLKRLKVDAELLPLHGELEAEEQDKCFARYARPKCVVATNVAQTSITIDDIDAVVDSGVERRIELVDGVEGLYLRAISKADSAQRKGRSGRTKPGVYIDWCTARERLEFPKAEILRSRLDQTVLRLAMSGFDMEELTFFHQPDRAAIHEAKRALRALGCMTANSSVTRIGERVSRLPISVENARMIVEAERLQVVDDVISIAAILEQGGIIARKVKIDDETYDGQRLARARFFPDEKDSDLFAQLAVFKEMRNISKIEARENGVHLKSYFQAQEKRRHIADSLRGRVREFRSNGNREDILRAVCAGMVDHLWQYSRGAYVGDNQRRELSNESVLRYGDTAEWLVGHAFDLEIKTRRRGLVVLKLVTMTTRVNLAWLTDVAPQLLEVRPGINLRYDAEKDSVVSTAEKWFTNHKIGEETIDESENPEAPRVFARWLAGQSRHTAIALNEAIELNCLRNQRAEQLNRRAGETLFEVIFGDALVEHYLGKLNRVVRVADIRDPRALHLPALDAELAAQVERENPVEVVLLGGMQRVDYQYNPPRVVLPREVVDSGVWRELPDHVLLPGGREVEVELTINWSSTRGTGEAVKAELEFRELKKEADKLSEKLKKLREDYRVPYSREGWVDHLEADVRRRLFDEHLSSYVPSERDSVVAWMERVEILVADVERSAAGHEEREAAFVAAGARREILRDFRAYVRRGGSQQGDGWVVTSDGSLREPDEVDHDHPRGFRYSHKIWRVVGPTELALSWREDWGEVAHRAPGYEPTPSQLATVREIEREVGLVPGSFGLDPKAAARNERLLAEVTVACQRSKALSSVPEFDILKVLGEDGQEMYEEHVAGSDPGKFVNHSKPFSERCSGRDAQVVDSQSAGDGVLEFLVYDKYGRWNLNIRHRNHRDAEPTATDGNGEVDPDSPFAKLAGLKKKLEENGKN